MLAHLHTHCNAIVIIVFHLTGVDVLNGSFNGTAPENCEGGTVTEIPVHLRSSV